MPELDALSSLSAIIDECEAALKANAAAEAVLRRLRAIEAQAAAAPILRARWLIAKGVAVNRLGLHESLGDFGEAAEIAEKSGDGRLVAEAKRAAAIAHAWRGEGREAGLSLLRALAESLVAGDRAGISLSLIESGRLELEMGRPRDAAAFFDRALQLGEALPPEQRCRAEVNRMQALSAAGAFEEALRLHEAISASLALATPRVRLLAAIEQARCYAGRSDFAAAGAAIEAARALAPTDESAFEAIDIAEAEAELALAQGEFNRAASKLPAIVARCAEDDLAGREVVARLKHAKALAALGRDDEAAGTLAAALRRAVARGLVGHADQARSALAAAGFGEALGTSDWRLETSDEALMRRFVRRRPLGAGAQGSVSSAYDVELGFEVALKRVNLAGVYDIGLRESLLATARTEIRAASRIDHPGVARTRGLIVEPSGDATLIEDLVKGPNLRALMQAPMACAQAFDLTSRVAFALAAIHEQKIVHCDIKPENIVLDGASHPVIVDFGIALLDPGRCARGGTPAYRAPEQARGASVDARADLFALGVVTLEMLGVEPEQARRFWRESFWRGTDATSRLLRARQVDETRVALLRRLVAPIKFLRPGSAAAVGRGLRDAAAPARSA
jgi:tetratricopeptide (TPR) repeat protein